MSKSKCHGHDTHVRCACSWLQVAGTNYKIKVKVGDTDFIHVTIFKPLPHTQASPSVSKVVTGKAEGDAL